GPARASPGVSGRLGGVLARVAALRPGAQPRAVDRISRSTGDRRGGAFPRRGGGPAPHLSGPPRARARDRGVRLDVRNLAGAGAGAGRGARLRDLLAGGVPGESSVRGGGDGTGSDVRPRVSSAATSALRPGRPDARDRWFGRAHL